ncbi:MAG: leucyl aminopeptidase [Burkholderiaceae bacterium]
MQFSIKALPIESAKTDCLLVPVISQKRADGAAISGELDTLIQDALKSGDLQDKAGSDLLLRGAGAIKRVLLVSLGSNARAEAQDFVRACDAAYARLATLGAQDVLSLMGQAPVEDREPDWLLQQELLAARRQAYRFEQMKSKKSPRRPRPAKVAFAHTSARARELKPRLAHAQALANGMDLTRDLGNLPANVCTPTYLANTAKKMGREHKLKVQVLDERQMRQLSMGALLAVAQGSEQPPKLIIMQHNGGRAGSKPVVIVGKGITFDTGGISIKPAAGMDEMKYDMGGAAAVFGIMRAIAEMKLKLNVVAIVPTCENMPSGRATRPGDIVTSMSGQTIEILNTDAEGRLILCDALTYAERFKPAAVVDMATLTGACVVALGHHHSGLFARENDLAEELLSAGRQTLDTCWRMPLDAAYNESLKSPFADMANVGGRDAGAVTAACFLERYTRAYPWAHLDIAGTAWHSGAKKGSSARPVALMVGFLENRAG